MRTLLLILAVALAGCDTFSDSIRASLTASTAPSTSAALVLTNTGDATFSLGPIPCEVDLEVEGDGGWEPSDHEPLVVCTDVLTLVAPGETAEGTYPMKGVPNGTYRFRLTVSETDGEGTREVVSNEIAVASADE